MKRLLIISAIFLAGLLGLGNRVANLGVGGGGLTPIVQWNLNESGGTSIAAAYGPTATTNGTLGSGYVTVNGTTGYVNSNSAVTFGSSTITAMGWYKVTAYSQNGTGKRMAESSANYSGGNNRWCMYSAWGLICFGVTDNAGNDKLYSIVAPTDNVEAHIAVTFDNASAAVPLGWVNGSPVTVTIAFSAWASAGTFTSQTVYLMSKGGSADFAGGTVNDFRIYSSALTNGDISTIYAAGAQ